MQLLYIYDAYDPKIKTMDRKLAISSFLRLIFHLQ